MASVNSMMADKANIPLPPTFPSKLEEREFLKFRLAQAFRIFGNLGYNEGVAGHITLRDPIDPTSFWVNPFGLHFSLIQPEDLLLVEKLNNPNEKEESGPRRILNTAAYMIHSAIHSARPDVVCAAHTHSIHGKAFSTLGVELDMLSQDACAFFNDHALYNQFNGVVLNADEGLHIASALGKKKAAILQNHGILVATDSIEATVFFYIALERACQVQLMADAAAAGRGRSTITIPDEEALVTYKTNGSLKAGWFQGLPEFQLLEAREGNKFTPRFLLQLALIASSAIGVELFDRNLAYSSPFADSPQLAHNTRALHEHTLRRRQTIDAAGFSDDHYVTFYGSKLGNSPFIWAGGVNFTHSVASGDPYDTTVLLWTRAVPTSPSGAEPDQSVPVCVAYEVSKESSFSGHPVDSGEAFTSYDVDFTVKVEAKNLQPDTTYFYRFSDCATKATSPIGSTRTIAHPSTPAHEVNGGKPLVMAVFSCSQYQAGWFNAYGYAAHNTSADLFLHLGDYVADNAWKAGTADSNDTAVGCAFSPSGACFTDRKLAAVRAYHEWMPIRQVDPKDELRIWRNFQIGQLLDLTMLDTRQYERDLTDVYYNTDVNTISSFPNRSLMGLEQEQCMHTYPAISCHENSSSDFGFDETSGLYSTLSESKQRGAVWRIIGQQIVFTQLQETGGFDLDAWDGYRANRARVLDHLYSNKISNTIILSGDSHANWVSDLAHPNDTTTYNPVTGEGAIGVEFAGTAVTSGSAFGSGITPAKADIQSTTLVQVNADLQWSEGSYRGFFTLSIDPNQVNATYYAMRNITFANLDGFASAQFNVKKEANKLTRPVAGGSVLAGVLKSQAKAQKPLVN
ncbi:hypothetical protein CVT24_007024 [Panaeolus cyanescens]|uniref:Class II aldolase/adducin N-terminal domain-containing protein n=1 Tax=Panaeolus cyanescens TaxID=181874 RepID=A0A409YKI9_9AGAR|nr:hypothetical protein CVT24_007024 [Panaeolus cyanescens]